MRSEREKEPGGGQQFEAMQLELMRAKQALSQAKTEIEMLRQQRAAADEQVAKTRAMLSFQLGYSLLRAFKSWRGFFGLPRRLLGLWREARRRRRRLTGRSAPLRPLTARSQVPHTDARGNGQVPPTFELPAGASAAERLRTLVVASILDESMHSSFRDECRLLALSPSQWKEQLEMQKPDLLLVGSALFGVDGAWQGKVNHVADELVGVVQWCRSRQVPTLFWNNEDPVQFETFLTIAQLFDYVFTTDIDCIHRYKAALGHDRVYLLPFACQPRTHHPIATRERKPGVVFAGAYYVRYPERARDLANLVLAMAALGPVDIYDRNYGKTDPNCQFPEEYRPFIVGRLPFGEFDKAYKGYELALNLNSTKQSQSMFSRRVFELLACNTLVVSNYSRGLRLLFGELVTATDSGEKVARRIRELRSSPALAQRLRLAGLRKVMLEHCYQERFAYMVGRVLGTPIASLLPTVVVTGYAENAEELEALRRSVKRQDYDAVRLLVALAPGFAAPLESLAPGEAARFVEASEASELMLRDVVGEGELVAGMSPRDYYGPSYLLDLVLATRYSDAWIIGKAAHYEHTLAGELRLVNSDEQYRSVNALPARAALLRRALVAEQTLGEWARGLDSRAVASGSDGHSGALAVDALSYCLEAGLGATDERIESLVDGGSDLDVGVTFAALQREAEAIPPEALSEIDSPELDGQGLAHRAMEPGLVLGRADTLVLSNNYPSAADLYRNAFVHSRVLAYSRQGLRADVFRLRSEEALSFHEYEGVDVITGSASALRKLLSTGHYRRVFVHFLSEAMWQVLSEFSASIQVCVWLHGAEIHTWQRRIFNHTSEQELELAKMGNERRMAFWRRLLGRMPKNLRLVFVSQRFADEVMADLGLELPRGRYAVFNNPIDATLFSYVPKPAEQRKRILLIRPFATRQYANDIAAAAILALKAEPFFAELEFRIVGEGRLFDEVTLPLRALGNVILDQRFLPQAEIAKLHRDYGLFLCPTRWDSQGVSRDEAMASGLVPLTNDVAAVREFVDDECGVLAPPEDYAVLAAGIARLYREPDRFLAMSRAAAERVRQRSDAERVVREELAWVGGACPRVSPRLAEVS